MATATDRIERYGRRARWLHAGVYLPTLGLLATGLWLLGGQEGHPSILSRLTGVADTRLHIWLGWGLTAVLALGLVAGVRAIPTFLRETIRHDRGDGRWFVRWPKAVFTGRFARHEGKWDPGQRIANLVIVVSLPVLIVTGVGLATLHGGHAFAVMAKVHKWTALVLTPVLLGHVVIAAGVLPGYKGRLALDAPRRAAPERHRRASVAGVDRDIESWGCSESESPQRGEFGVRRGISQEGVLAGLIRALRGLLTGPARRLEFGETLTDREVDVLRLLPTDLSQREIGDELYLSVNTVKTHARAVYASSVSRTAPRP